MRSGGRQPAVVPKNAPATGSDFRELITLTTHDGPVYHGWLTPPALGCACGRTVTRAALRYRDASPHSHGWLTPAAPGARCRSGEKITTFAVYKRTFYKSGGRQPAVGWQTHLQDDSICVRRISARGAAGVSPPWVGKRACRTIRFAFGEQPHEERRASARRGTEKRTCNAVRFPGTDYIRHAPRASAPRGAYAPRSWLRVRWNRDESGLRCRDASPHGHGWLTPAAPGARCRSGEEITTFAVHKRMFSRAAGVSPPWYRKTHLQRGAISGN
jgi:hypothetical protein